VGEDEEEEGEKDTGQGRVAEMNVVASLPPSLLLRHQRETHSNRVEVGEHSSERIVLSLEESGSLGLGERSSRHQRRDEEEEREEGGGSSEHLWEEG